MKTIKIPIILQKMSNFFLEAGFESWLVGGAVRDTLRGKTISDFDLATNAQPEQVIKLFKRVIPTGIEHGTVTVIFMGHHIEVTTFRTEKDYTNGRHPDSVTYASNIEEDLSRRDFTMNAIAARLDDGFMYDPFNGKADIKKGIIRTVGKAEERFLEDGLRPIRAIRFACQLDFAIEAATLRAISTALPVTKQISIERFRDELCKILASNSPSKGLKLMEKTGILRYFIPELADCRGVLQADSRGHHIFDVFDHLAYACDHAIVHTKPPTIGIRLAALFHDIGKPPTRYEKDNTITFYNHEKISEKLCTKILERLRFPKNTVRYVSHLVLHHMFHYESQWSDAAIRRFIVRITPPDGLGSLTQTINDLFDLRIADVSGMTNTPALMQKGPWGKNLLEFKDRIEAALSESSVFSLKDLAINGKDLISIGIPPGKQVGHILNELLDMTIDDPDSNTPEKLLHIAKKLIEK